MPNVAFRSPSYHSLSIYPSARRRRDRPRAGRREPSQALHEQCRAAAQGLHLLHGLVAALSPSPLTLNLALTPALSLALALTLALAPSPNPHPTQVSWLPDGGVWRPPSSADLRLPSSAYTPLTPTLTLTLTIAPTLTLILTLTTHLSPSPHP